MLPPTGIRSETCDRCATRTEGEYFMIHDKLWATAVQEDERFLCIGCIELALGRQLDVRDFQSAPVNDWPRMNMGERTRSVANGIPGFPIRDEDVPMFWSARFLDRLGLIDRYQTHIDAPRATAEAPRRV
ncbi:MAG: hypothetical protein SangKO_099330 [Sandaracinaceae bacterium]